MPFDKPAAEVHLDEAVVREMLVEQCPQWAGEPIRFVLAGWDNAMFRLGDDLMVRVPRRAASVSLIDHEQRWLPELAPNLPLPIPVPVYAGTPGDAYPWPWSVVTYAPGRSGLDIAVEADWAPDGVAGSIPVATALGRFHAALSRVPVPDDPPRNPYRGMPLAERQDRVDECIKTCRDVLDAETVERVERIWEDCLAAPVSDVSTWLHGDLHPGNIVIDTGIGAGPAAVSVVDFGDICTGDPACDLLLGWQLFTPTARETFRAATGVDDATWMRGRGWALTHGLMALANSADDPTFAALGRHAVLAAVAE